MLLKPSKFLRLILLSKDYSDGQDLSPSNRKPGLLQHVCRGSTYIMLASLAPCVLNAEVRISEVIGMRELWRGPWSRRGFSRGKTAVAGVKPSVPIPWIPVISRHLFA